MSNQRKEDAEKFKQKLINDGEKDEKYLAFMYRQAMINGVTTDIEDYL